jgi:hypothetical protein
MNQRKASAHQNRFWPEADEDTPAEAAAQKSAE